MSNQHKTSQTHFANETAERPKIPFDSFLGGTAAEWRALRTSPSEKIYGENAESERYEVIDVPKPEGGRHGMAVQQHGCGARHGRTCLDDVKFVAVSIGQEMVGKFGADGTEYTSLGLCKMVPTGGAQQA